MIRFLQRLSICGFAALLVMAPLYASPMDEESKQIFSSLIKQHADSVVRISFVISSSYQGQEQRQESSTTGVVVDKRGLILVPKIVVAPTFPGMNELTAEQKASFKLETRDFRIYFPGQDRAVEAEALTADADQGIAWLKLKNADASLLKPLDLKNIAEAAPGQAYYVIERLEKRFDEAPILSWGIITGSIHVPQKVHIVNGAAGLALSAEGKVLGFVSADMEATLVDPLSMSPGLMRMMMFPAQKLAASTLRAASLLDEDSKSD